MQQQGVSIALQSNFTEADTCGCYPSVPLMPPPHVVLECECATVIAQFAHVPALRDAIQLRGRLRRKFTALNAAKTNFKEIARVGVAHKASAAAVLRQPLSGKNFVTLADRHAALVQKVTATCAMLAEAEDFDVLELFGEKLEQLKKLDVSALPQSSSAISPVPLGVTRVDTKPLQYGALVGDCDSFITEFKHVPTFRDVIRRREELQREYNALKAAATNYCSLARVGKALKAAVAAVVLTEEDYLTLADRHAALVRRATATCSVLADAGEFNALEFLATKLEELKALDVSALPQSWANDPALPPVPSAEEGEDDCANDPVYVAMDTDETTLA
jgi:hypothetical protein